MWTNTHTLSYSRCRDFNPAHPSDTFIDKKKIPELMVKLFHNSLVKYHNYYLSLARFHFSKFFISLTFVDLEFWVQVLAENFNMTTFHCHLSFQCEYWLKGAKVYLWSWPIFFTLFPYKIAKSICPTSTKSTLIVRLEVWDPGQKKWSWSQ